MRPRYASWYFGSVAIGLMLSTAFCSRTSQQPKDDSKPRIVSVGGPITETVFALGAGDMVVGVDTSASISFTRPRLRQHAHVRRNRRVDPVWHDNTLTSTATSFSASDSGISQTYTFDNGNDEFLDEADEGQYWRFSGP